MTTTTTRHNDTNLQRALTVAAEFAREQQPHMRQQLRRTIEDLVGYYDANNKFQLPAPVRAAMGL